MDRKGILETYHDFSAIKPISEAIYRTLYTAITRGHLHSGDRITIDGLATLCSASRTPVREAMKQLESNGILTYDQRVGYYVRIYSQKDCLDLFEVLHILQVAAVSVAAKTISPSYLAMLDENVRLCRATEDGAVFFSLNRDFHVIIARSANNAFLAEYIEQIYSRLFLFDFSKNPTLNMPESIDQHRLLVEALRARDSEEAVRIHTHHAKVTGNYFNWALTAQNSAISSDVL